MSFILRVLGITLITVLTLKILLKPTYVDKSLRDGPYTIDEGRNPSPQHGAIIKLYDSPDAFFCTAFVISNKYAVTAGHCLDELNFIGATVIKTHPIIVKGELSEETGILVRAVGVNPRLDWGLVVGDFSNFDKVRPVFDTLFKPSPIPLQACGFPMGKKDLWCSPFFPQGLMGFSVVGPGALFPGMSGGPVFDAITGNVVGVVSYASNGYVGIFPLIGLTAYFGIEE